MNSELTIRLAEIEKSSPIKNDRDLLGAILGIIEKERAKRAGARNYALLEEAIDASFMLEGADFEKISRDAASVEKKALAAIPEEKESNYPFVRARWLIPAVVIIAALLAVVTAAKVFDLPFFGREMREAIREELPDMTEGTVYECDGWEISIGEIMSKVYTLDELDSLIARDGLLLPYGAEVKDVEASDYGDSYRLILKTDLGTVDIKTERNWGDAAPAFVRIGAFDVVYSHYDGIWQGEFVWKGCMYCLTSDAKEGLENLIGSMEESAK